MGVCLSDDRVEFEENLIRSFLEKIDVDFYDIIWDGFNLIIENMEKESKTLTRNDIKDYISELDLSKYLIEE